MVQPTHFVLIHGANLGGWCWDGVATILTAHGHHVLTPTLDFSARASLRGHINAVIDLIEHQDLHDVVLVGHSYGGMVITGVADRLNVRLRHLVYLDAAVPADGDDFASHVPGLSAKAAEDRRQFYRGLSQDGIWLLPPPLDLVGIIDPVMIDAVTPRLVPHPLATWLEAVRLPNGGTIALPKTYVLAVSPPTEIMGYPRHGEAARRSDDWAYREIHAGHTMMLAAPEATAALLLEAAAGAGN